jgi:hypothetical protein
VLTVFAVVLSLLDPHGRMILLLVVAPYYLLWAFLFSYEVRTLAMDLPFVADCCACGVAAAAAICTRVTRSVRSRLFRPAPVVTAAPTSKAAKRFIKKAGKQVSKPPRALSWTWLAGGVLAALALAGVAWAGGPIWRWERSFAWLRDMEVVWRWPLAAAFALGLAAPWAASHQFPLRLRFPVPAVLLLCAGAIAAAQMTVWPSEVLRRDQTEKRKQAGNPSLNAKLYQFAHGKSLGEGAIVTDNLYLAFLPELDHIQRYMLFPQPATREFLDCLLVDPSARYVLAYSPAFPDTMQKWMTERGFVPIFKEAGYEFIELPARRF